MMRNYDDIRSQVNAMLTHDNDEDLERVTAMKEVCAMYVHNIGVSVEPDDYEFLESRVIESVEKFGCVVNGSHYELRHSEYEGFCEFNCDSFILQHEARFARYVLVETWVSTLFANLPLPDCILNIIYNFARHHHEGEASSFQPHYTHR